MFNFDYRLFFLLQSRKVFCDFSIDKGPMLRFDHIHHIVITNRYISRFFLAL